MALEQITFNIGAFNDSDAGGNNYFTDTVFEVKNQSDNTFATIYADSSGTNQIPQNGIDNVSNSRGECNFYIDDGDFYIEVDSQQKNFNIGNFKTDFTSVDEVKAYSKLSKLIGQRIETDEHHTGTGYGGASYDVVSAGSVTPNGVDVIQGVADSGAAAVLVGDVVSVESIGYLESSANFHSVVYVAASNGRAIRVTDDTVYHMSDTLLIPSNGVDLSTESGDFTNVKVQAVSPMTASDLLVDTENYDYLYDNSVRVTNPTNPSDISSPKLIRIKGIVFSGLYDASYLPSPNQGEGIGARLYGRFMHNNFKVENVENVGILTYYPFSDGGVVAGDNDNVYPSRTEMSVFTYNTGREGFVFDGPADSTLIDVVCRDASASNFGLQDISPVNSVEYPDSEKLSPAIDIRKPCHHSGFMNGFGTRNGWSTVISKNRFESTGHVQVDSSDGGLFVRNGAWAQFASLEFHGMTYGFIEHSGELRPCILSESVQGFLCPNLKGSIGGNWSNRPLIDIQGTGANVNATITPIYSNSPSDVGRVVKVSGTEHNVNAMSSGSLSGSDCVFYTLSSLLRSKISGSSRFTSNLVVDLTGLDSSVDKSNIIDIIGLSSLANMPATVSGIDTLTQADLKRTNIVMRSTSLDKDYSTRTTVNGSAIAISDTTVTQGITHDYLGQPSLSQIRLGFTPADTATVMPVITDVKISSITSFSVNIEFAMTGGSGSLLPKIEIN